MKYNRNDLEYINQTPEICLEAVKQYYKFLEDVPEAMKVLKYDSLRPTGSMFYEEADSIYEKIGICKDEFLKSIKKPTPEICLYILRIIKNGNLLNDLTEKEKEEDKKYSFYIYFQNFIQDTKNECLDIFYKYRWKNEELNLEIVKSCPYYIQYVHKQTPELCFEAVKKCGDSLKYIEKQTPELCLEAIKEDGLALQHVVIERTFNMCLEAVKQNPDAIRYSPYNRISLKFKPLINRIFKNQ